MSSEAIELSSDEEEEEEERTKEEESPSKRIWPFQENEAGEEIVEIISSDDDEGPATTAAGEQFEPPFDDNHDDSDNEEQQQPSVVVRQQSSAASKNTNKTKTKKRRLSPNKNGKKRPRADDPRTGNNNNNKSQKNGRASRTATGSTGAATATTNNTSNDYNDPPQYADLFQLPSGFREYHLEESKSMLHCCMNGGRMAWAYHRFVHLREQDPETLCQEILEHTPELGYPLHQLLFQTTNPQYQQKHDHLNPAPLVTALLEFGSQQLSPRQLRTMLKWTTQHKLPSFCPHKSHAGRMALHVACWGMVDRRAMKLIMFGYPLALQQQDAGGRTPLDVLQFYHFKGSKKKQIATPQNRLRKEFLEQSIQRWRNSREGNANNADDDEEA